jgi:uncharacterized membrane protein
MDIETSKNLSGVGAILLIIGMLGFFASGYTGILSLIGIILLLIGMKGLANYYNDDGIFNNTLYGFITTIVGGVAVAVGVIAAFLLSLSTLFEDIGDWSEIGPHLTQYFDDPNFILELIGLIIVALVIVFIFAVIAAIFYRKSFDILAKKSGVSIFGTAGLLLLIGAILTIVLVGFVIIWVAFILLAVGFFSIRPSTSTQTPEQTTSS